MDAKYNVRVVLKNGRVGWVKSVTETLECVSLMHKRRAAAFTHEEVQWLKEGLPEFYGVHVLAAVLI